MIIVNHSTLISIGHRPTSLSYHVHTNFGTFIFTFVGCRDVAPSKILGKQKQMYALPRVFTGFVNLAGITYFFGGTRACSIFQNNIFIFNFIFLTVSKLGTTILEQ